MKRFFSFLTAAIAAVGISSAAQAFSVPIGEWNAHFSDFTATYDSNGVAQNILHVPTAGDYVKSQINLDQVIPKGGGLSVWNPSATDQVAGFEYGFEFLGLVGVPGSGSEKSYWGPITEPQSRIDLYNRNAFVWNTGAGFAPQTGPMDPNMNPGSPGAPGIVSGINDAGSSLLIGMYALLHPDQTFAGATLVVTGNILTGVGSGDLYAVADSGSFLSQIDHQILGPAQIPSDFYFKFSTNANQPLYGWTVRSEDPAEFSTVPEPSTMMLMGSGILGLAGYGFARRRNKE